MSVLQGERRHVPRVEADVGVEARQVLVGQARLLALLSDLQQQRITQQTGLCNGGTAA